jgi:hypothetical protein
MSAWGAGVLSCSYILKIETRDYKVAGGTMWLAYLSGKNKPNSIWVDALGFAADGSLCYAGRSAWGLIQTGNSLVPEGEPAGPYVAVLNGECSSLRFSSSVPACGKVEVGDGTTWGIAQGTVDGRPVVLFVTGCEDREEIYGKTLPPPRYGAMSENKFAGGFTDGYAVLLDLGTGEPTGGPEPVAKAEPAAPEPEKPPPPPGPAEAPEPEPETEPAAKAEPAAAPVAAPPARARLEPEVEAEAAPQAAPEKALPARIPRPEPTARRRSSAAAYAIAGAVALVAGGIGAYWFMKGSRLPPGRAERGRRRNRGKGERR